VAQIHEFKIGFSTWNVRTGGNPFDLLVIEQPHLIGLESRKGVFSHKAQDVGRKMEKRSSVDIVASQW
jgi:hypothetical protein